MKYFSMFSGIGGFELGIGSGHDCVGYSEIDKYAIKVYERHFKHENKGDATTINPNELPDFELLVGGFPCQAFSIAGKRAGFNDTRGTLFFDIARILKDKRPRHLLLENVKGLLSHDSGKTFQTILKVLADLGYRVEWQVLNSKDFGVPQNRERIFIVGHLGAECSGQVFPISGSSKNNIDQLNQPTHSNDRIYGTKGLAPTLNTAQGGRRQPKIAPTLRANHHNTADVHFVAPVPTPDRPTKRQNGRRFKENGEPSFTLTGQDKHGVQVDSRIRRLTPKECERLQGFPDDWTRFGEASGNSAGVEISDTQRYKMCGNAVTVNVVADVMKEFCEIKGERL